MKTLKLLIFYSSLLLLSCSTLKNSMLKTGNSLKDTAIQNAIIDFSHKCSLFRHDSVFLVSFEDSIFSLALEQTNELDLHWARNRLYEEFIAVGIIAFSDYQYYFSEETKHKLPSRYAIKSGKLFYWRDDSYPVSDEMVEILWKYNLLQEDLIIPEFSTIDSKKGADYYFCKNDLSKYKRVITNTGIGYYKPPKFKCSE